MEYLKYILLILIGCSLLISGNNLLAFDNPTLKTNIEIIDSLLNNYSDNFAKSQSFQKGEIIRLEITAHPAKWLLRNKLLRVITLDSCIIVNDSLKQVNKFFEISINNLSVKYLNSKLSSDSLDREILINISGLKRNNDKIEPLEEYRCLFRDRIARDNVESVDSKQYDFTTSPVPVQEKTFFEEIVQPVILITSTIVAVVLLFTVRSN